jgi:hypothetical protein
MISQYLKKILVMSLLTICYVCWGYANSADKVDIKIIKGKIILYGHELKTKHEVKISSPRVSTDTLVSTNLSPNNNNLIVGLRYTLKGLREWEFWFYDISKRGDPVQIIPTSIPIQDVGIKWLSENIFQIEWGGYGWEQSRFYDAKNLNNSFLCDDCVFYDVVKDVYVAQRDSKIEIGPGFYKDNFKAELFNLGLQPNFSVDDVIDAIKDVKIENTGLVVFCDRGKGFTEKLFFEPLILKEKQSSK